MKLPIALALSGLFIGEMNHADAPTCNSAQLELGLSADAPNNCASLELEGEYFMRTCDNGRGSLTQLNHSTRPIHLRGDIWMARTDILDYDELTLTTELLQIDRDLKEFLLLKVVTSKRDGSVLEDYKCGGSIKIKAQ